METLSADAVSVTPSVGRFHRDQEGSFRAPFLGAIPSTKELSAPFGNLDQLAAGWMEFRKRLLAKFYHCRSDWSHLVTRLG